MIECWFDFGSNYSYLSVMRLEQEAATFGVSVAWRSFPLGPIFKSLGWDSSPFALQEAKGKYVWQDMPRQCSKYGLPWRHPTQFPRRALLPMRVALLGEDQPWIGSYCRRIISMNFAEDRDIDTADAVGEALAELGQPVEQLLHEARSDAIKQRVRERTEQAREHGIFGAPTFLVGGAMYWGNDRLEEALAFAKASKSTSEGPLLKDT